MNLFQNVKYGVNCREAAERYGVSINRQGKALCPFVLPAAHMGM